MLFVETKLSYDRLAKGRVINSSGQPVGEDVAKIEYDEKEKSFVVRSGKKSMAIREGLYTKAKDSGVDQVIKIDFNQSKARRIDRDKIQERAQHVRGKAMDVSSPEVVDAESFEIETTRLKDLNFDPRIFHPIKTGTYLDGFLSYKGGLLPGTNIMLTGDPGVGKSSNLMDILINVKVANPDKRVLYVSAEMSEIDVKEFQQYYPGLDEIDFLYISNYVTDPDLNILPYQALLSVLHQGWDLVVLDSLVEVQSMVQEDMTLSYKKAEKWMLDLMKKHNSGHNKRNLFTTFLAIQQKNKAGLYVGSKRLEHMTTAFLNLCWDKKEKGKRYMVFEKNRKGKERVKLYYNFDKEKGIVYDESRHEKEQIILDRLQTPSEYGIEEFDISQFETLFKEENHNDDLQSLTRVTNRRANAEQRRQRIA